jgi:hypothetical protein
LTWSMASSMQDDDMGFGTFSLSNHALSPSDWHY